MYLQSGLEKARHSQTKVLAVGVGPGLLSAPPARKERKVTLGKMPWVQATGVVHELLDVILLRLTE